MNMARASIATGALLLLAASARAQGQDALYTRSLAATCAACHGTDGHAAAGSKVPALAGVARQELATLLREFKAGARPATLMTQLSKGFSDAQIDQLAAYFSAQKP